MRRDNLSKEKLTAEDVKKIIAEKQVDFIRLQFVDITGRMKNVAITAEEIDKALNGEMMFDGSSIEGFVRIEESDMYLRPNPETFVIMPWFDKQEHTVARMICDIYKPDGTPFEGDPRYILKSAIDEARQMGFEFNLGPECEFFLFNADENGNPTTATNDEASYFDLAPIDNGEAARIAMVKTLMNMGFKIEAAHHENAPGQHEIDFKYSDALSAADNIITFKLVVKIIAKKYGLHATFMPKPINNECGSGMHCNMSLFKDGKNAFYDPNDKNGLSQIAYYYIGGILKHAKSMTALTNPIVNSYKRLIPGFEAPVYIAWSTGNRSPLVRIPSARGVGTRIELRHPDPSCNPYLAIAAMLRAGLDGIKNKIEPGEPIEKNIFRMSDDDLNESHVEKLPANLYEALVEMSKDEIIKNALGKHVYNNYMKAKNLEWKEYTNLVHPWEISKYIKMY